MRLAIVHIGDETDPAGVMLIVWRIKALRGRQPRIEVDRPGKIGSVISHFPLNRAIKPCHKTALPQRL